MSLVFPTLVGVFLLPGQFSHRWAGLPHARGGVSLSQAQPDLQRLSSPRSWGCFLRGYSFAGFVRVFPTLVGVFPQRSPQVALLTGLPHARGGVSRMCRHLTTPTLVFPTLVGVFPAALHAHTA